MKKIILSLLFFLILTVAGFSQTESSIPVPEGLVSNFAQDTISTLTGKGEQIKSGDSNVLTPLSHWSLGIKGGINYFRIASSTLNRTSQFHVVFGGTLEYTLNPLVGFGIEYVHNPFGCSTPTTIISGGTNEGLIYGSVNLSNLLIPNRPGQRKWNVYGNGGFGFAFYRYSFDQNATQTDESALATLGLNLEYTLSKSLSLGIESQYRYYNWKLEQVNTIYNTEAVTATLGLRYKFNAAGKKQHVRNLTVSEYNPKPAPILVEKIVRDNTDETKNRLKALEDENAALNTKLNKLNEAIQSLTQNEKPVIDASFQNIEFEFGSDKLDISAYKILDQIADMLIKNSATVKLNVAGYTDYIGSAEYNKVLSVKRANAVKDYLMTRQVPANRISIFGYGKDHPIAPNESVIGRQKNRRVEFQFTK